MTADDAQKLFRLPDHAVIKRSGDWAFRCPGWGTWWGYPRQEVADFFLAAHLLYPVPPCTGLGGDDGSDRRYTASHPAACLLARDANDLIVAGLRLGRGEDGDIFPCHCPTEEAPVPEPSPRPEQLLEDLARDERPDPERVAEVIAWYYTLPGNSVGGSLHLALDDLNLEPENLAFCHGYALGRGDTVGATLAGVLSNMTVMNLAEAINLWRGAR